MSFIEEATEWLNPLGYTLNSYAASGRSAVFTNTKNLDDLTYPSITCYMEGMQQRCSLCYPGLKMFIAIQSGDLQFKHPDIAQYIKIMKHYAEVCEQFNPF